jgi:DNA-binding NarL/FixJ family response regulator
MLARAARVCSGVSNGVTELTASPCRPTMIVADDHGDGALTVRAVGDLKPKVAVLDIEMPVMNGFEAAEQIAKIGIPTKIVFLSIYRDSDYIQCANAKGASYVLKSKMQSDLLTAVRNALDRRNSTSNL